MAAARSSVGARTEFGSSSRWIDRWLAACRDLAELERSNPMTDAVVEEIDGRMIRIGDQWLADFATERPGSSSEAATEQGQRVGAAVRLATGLLTLNGLSLLT